MTPPVPSGVLALDLCLDAAPPHLLTLSATASAQPRPCFFHGMNPGAPVWDDVIVLDATLASEIALAAPRPRASLDDPDREGRACRAA